MNFNYDEEEIKPEPSFSEYFISESESSNKDINFASGKPKMTVGLKKFSRLSRNDNVRPWKLSLFVSILVIIALSIVSIFAMAQDEKIVIKEIPMTMDIVSKTEHTVGAYFNSQLDAPIENVKFGSVEQGAIQRLPMWVKNETPEVSIKIYGELIGDIDDWATPSITPPFPVSLAPGEVQMFEIIFAVMSGAETGTKTFSFRIIDDKA